MSIVRWPKEVQAVMMGDLTAAAGYVTTAGGAVVSSVAPCGLVRPEEGVVGFTTSLAFGRKLARILRDPRVAVAYHAREHGFCSDSRFVLAQGVATVDLTPSRERLDRFAPQAERYVGEVRRGPVWDRVLSEYYADRVFVDIAVRRVIAWPDLGGFAEPTVFGEALSGPTAPQVSPRNGTAPRVDVRREAGRISTLPHRVLAYRGADGFPVIVPVTIGGHDAAGLRIVAPPKLLPRGGRRAGLLAHAYRPELVGLRTRTYTGWLDVDDENAVYAPHTSKGFAAPPNKSLLLLGNGIIAQLKSRQARRRGDFVALERLATERRTGERNLQ
jgi:hypothetical protein